MILGISFDAPEANAAFARKYEFPYRLLSDTTRAVGLAYRACETAEDSYARRITYVIGTDGNIEQAIDTQSPAAQASEIVASLTRARHGPS